MNAESEIRQEVVLIEGGASRSERYALGAGERLHLCAFVLGGDATDTNRRRPEVQVASCGGSKGEPGVSVASPLPAALSVEVSLEGPGAEVVVDGLFIANSENPSADTRISLTVRHLAPDCKSRQTIKGIVGGRARGEFSGRIYVAPGADRTDAEQHSRNLVLSDTATVISRPELEIYADDVRCVHGATVGSLDPEAIYYMRQRGISAADAHRMQLEGFALDVVDRVPDSNVSGDTVSNGTVSGAPARPSRTAIFALVASALARETKR